MMGKGDSRKLPEGSSLRERLPFLARSYSRRPPLTRRSIHLSANGEPSQPYGHRWCRLHPWIRSPGESNHSPIFGRLPSRQQEPFRLHPVEPKHSRRSSWLSQEICFPRDLTKKQRVDDSATGPIPLQKSFLGLLESDRQGR